jgi:ABC-2 type transporter
MAIGISAILNPFIFITFALFCGVTIPYPQIPVFWRVWLYQLNPFTRLISGMVVTELHDRPVTCSEPELNRFNAPPGQSCGDYMAPFFAAGGSGYLVDNATSACAYCAYKVGDQFYLPLGFLFENRWRDLGILAAFIGSNLAFLFLGVSAYLSFPSALRKLSAGASGDNITVAVSQLQPPLSRVNSFFAVRLPFDRSKIRSSLNKDLRQYVGTSLRTVSGGAGSCGSLLRLETVKAYMRRITFSLCF